VRSGRARRLGASGPDRGDGVAANLTFRFPGELRHAVLRAGRANRSADDDDPWRVPHLVWHADTRATMLDIAEANDSIAQEFNHALGDLMETGREFDTDLRKFKG